MIADQPLIKWPGGKSREFHIFKDLIPAHKRYIEPFFGGGGVFFNLQPSVACVNDICSELVQLYRLVKGPEGRIEFEAQMRSYVKAWSGTGRLYLALEQELIAVYFEHKAGRLDKPSVRARALDLISKAVKSKNADFYPQGFVDEVDLFVEELTDYLTDKLVRTAKLEGERGALPDGDLSKNLETGIRSGFYMYFRGLMNRLRKDNSSASAPRKIANYYFVREFCYGSMFRYNSSGDFNIPYGGIAYNSKDFSSKVEYLLSKEVQRLFKDVVISHGDFEAFLAKCAINEDDFIFLDPPYDTEFSDYENSSFGQDDQRRLAELLCKTPGKFLLVIKSTDFVLSLYQNKPGIRMAAFDKTYMYNVKGRNVRDVEHLAVFNYEPPRVELI